MGNLRISDHAKQTYCLRHYNNIIYYGSHPEVLQEILNNIDSAHKSEHSAKEFFKGCINKKGRKGIKASKCILLEKDDLIYMIRKNTLVTVISVPGADKVSDFILQSKRHN